MATLFKVETKAEDSFRNLSAKEEWYEKMDEVISDDTEEFDLGVEAGSSWYLVTKDLTSPLKFVVAGEYRATETDNEDPDVGLVPAERVKEIYAELNKTSSHYFFRLLQQGGFDANSDTEYFDAIRSFYKECAEGNNAILSLITYP